MAKYYKYPFTPLIQRGWDSLLETLAPDDFKKIVLGILRWTPDVKEAPTENPMWEFFVQNLTEQHERYVRMRDNQIKGMTPKQ